MLQSLFKLLNLRPEKISKNFLPLALLISLIGFFDSAYLLAEHVRGTVPNCVVIKGCDVVATSKYSTIAGGVPVALLGVIFYITFFLLLFSWRDFKKPVLFNLAILMTPFGFVTTLYLIYLQLFVIKAICIYCMLSAFTSTILFVISVPVLKQIWYNTRRTRV